MNERMTSIKNKIIDYKSQACPICFCDHENPIVLGCPCNTVFCMSCINLSLQACKNEEKNQCPMCRGKIIKITL